MSLEGAPCSLRSFLIQAWLSWEGLINPSAPAQQGSNPSFPIPLLHLSPDDPSGLQMIHPRAGALLWNFPKSCFEPGLPGKVSSSLPAHPKAWDFEGFHFLAAHSQGNPLLGGGSGGDGHWESLLRRAGSRNGKIWWLSLGSGHVLLAFSLSPETLPQLSCGFGLGFALNQRFLAQIAAEFTRQPFLLCTWVREP